MNKEEQCGKIWHCHYCIPSTLLAEQRKSGLKPCKCLIVEVVAKPLLPAKIRNKLSFI